MGRNLDAGRSLWYHARCQGYHAPFSSRPSVAHHEGMPSGSHQFSGRVFLGSEEWRWRRVLLFLSAFSCGVFLSRMEEHTALEQLSTQTTYVKGKMIYYRKNLREEEQNNP